MPEGRATNFAFDCDRDCKEGRKLEPEISGGFFGEHNLLVRERIKLALRARTLTVGNWYQSLAAPEILGSPSNKLLLRKLRNARGLLIKLGEQVSFNV